MEDKSKLLRERAKEELRKGKKIDPSLFETDLKILVEELSIYQIELENQNQELIHSQEEIQQSNDRYLDLFDNAPIGYLIVDRNGFIKNINQTACLLLENSKSELTNKKITKIIHRDFQDAYYLYFRSLINQKHDQTCDIKLRKSDNTYFYARIQGIRQLKIASNEPEFRLAIIDITIQKELEMKLQMAKEQAEESDRLKSAFLANMSHEIRTPMNGILGFADLLKEPGLTGEEQQEYIQIIGKSGNRMLNIINEIIDISKIEAGLMKLDLKDSNVNEQIDYIYTFFKPEVEAKGINLAFRNFLPPNEAILKTDREKVFAIFTNLVKNAIKYTNEGYIEIGYCKKDNYLEFYVKDTGIGIPKNRQEAIFERFIQADITDRKAYQGAGLGLSITKSYVEMLGGKIWVVSDEGIGSTFYFTLPYICGSVTEPSGYQRLPFVEKDNFRKLKILIAEDDEVSEMLISITIKEFSKVVLRAKTGIEVVEKCKNNPDLDLVFMDIKMPELGGYEATRQIREFNKDIVVIAQTSYGLSGDRERAIEAGCNDYIAKPINKTELQGLIQKYFKN